MLMFHEICTDFDKFKNYDVTFGEIVKPMPSVLKQIAERGVQCFVLGNIAGDNQKDLSDLHSYLEKINSNYYLPFPDVAVHFSIDGLKGVLMMGHSGKKYLDYSLLFFVRSGETGDIVPSHEYLKDFPMSDLDSMMREISRLFEHRLLFNRHSTEKPEFNGLSRQQRRSMGIKKVSDVVHLYPDTASPRKSYAVSNGLVKYEHTHRFDRSGHFRKIRGIGKDQTGTYGVQGLTWVKNHIVGPEDKPYVPKTRVVHTLSQQEEN